MSQNTQPVPSAPTNKPNLLKKRARRIKRIGWILGILAVFMLVNSTRNTWMPLVSPPSSPTATVTQTARPTLTATLTETPTPTNTLTVTGTLPTESPTPTASATATKTEIPTPIAVNNCLSQTVDIDVTFDKEAREFVLRATKPLIRVYDQKIGPTCLMGKDMGLGLVRKTSVEHVYEIRLPLAADRTIDGFSIWDDRKVYITSLTNGLMYTPLENAYVDLLISPALNATATPTP